MTVGIVSMVLSFALTIGVLVGSISQTEGAEYVRGCYYTNWAQYRPGVGKYEPSDYVRDLCTHIFYAFAKVDESDGTLKPFEWNDESTDWSKGYYQKVTDLKSQQPDLKVLLSVGGWNARGADGKNKPFKTVSATHESRQKFITSTVALLRKYQFDGFDIDWEYPEAEDKTTFAALLEDFRTAFEAEARTTGKARLLLTAAVSAAEEKIQPGYDVAVMRRTLDMMNLMSYDFHGAWEMITGINSGLYGRTSDSVNFRKWNTADAAKAWVDAGMPKEAVIIGLASYGRGWTLTDQGSFAVGAAAKGASSATTYAREEGIATYYEICDTLTQPGATRYFDSESKTPYMVKGDQWYTYDDVQSVSGKLDFVKEQGYGGGFFWTLDFDSFKGQCSQHTKNYPLISLMKDKLGGLSPAPKPTEITTQKPDQSTVCVCPTEQREPQTTRPTMKPTPTQRTGFPETKATTTVPSEPSTRAPIVTTASGQFQCPGDGLFADPSSRSFYYQCQDGVAHRMSCPRKLVWNQNQKACNWP